jgi:hypothetical protein
MITLYIDRVILCNKYLIAKSNLFFNIETFAHAIQCVAVCQSPANHSSVIPISATCGFVFVFSFANCGFRFHISASV